MKKAFILILALAIAGCASVTYKDKEGRELSYSRIGSQSIKGLTIEPTVNGVKMTMDSAQSDTQAMSTAVSDMAKVVASAAK